MSRTIVVNIKDCAKFDVYCGRASSCPEGFTGPGADGMFGNPYLLTNHSREISLELYRALFAKRLLLEQPFAEAVLALRGKVLGCWCVPLPCHAQVIADWLNK